MSAKTKKPEQGARQALLVLGMHRSGTSALSGVLASLGAHAPKTPMPGTADNERGYFESSVLADFHDELLRSAGSCWSDWEVFNPAWMETGESLAFGVRLQTLLEDEFGDAPMMLVKDPRICRFVPFWLRTLAQLQITPKVVIPLRNPMEVARSLGARDAFGLNRSLLIWLRHVLEAEVATRGVERSLVRYADLLEDWRSVHAKMTSDLDVVWPRWSGAVELEIDQFLTSQLRHQRTDEIHLASNAQVARWVEDAHHALESMATDPASAPEMQERLDAIRHEFDERSAAFAAVSMEHQQAAAEQQRQLELANDRIASMEQAYQALDASKHAEMAHATRLQAMLDEARAQCDVLDRRVTHALSLLDVLDQHAVGQQVLGVGAVPEDTQDVEAFLAAQDAHFAHLQEQLRQDRQGHAERVLELESQAARVAAAEDEVRLLRSRSQALQRMVAGHDTRHAALRDEIDGLQATLGSQLSVIASRDALVGRLQLQSDEQRTELASLRAALASQVAMIESRDAELDDLQARMADAVRAAQERIAELQDENAMLRKDATTEIVALERAHAEQIAALQRGMTTLRHESEQRLQEMQADLATARQAEEAEIAQLHAQLLSAVDAQAAAALQADEHGVPPAHPLQGVATLVRALEAEKFELLRRKQALELQLANRATDVAELQDEVDAVHGSLSWRLTSPLRRASRRFRGPQQAGTRRDEVLLIRESGLFDADWYLARYPDVAEAGADPIAHYLHAGADEGRDPGPKFSTRHYVDTYADVAASGMNPLVHYIRHGFAELREPIGVAVTPAAAPATAGAHEPEASDPA